MNAGDTVLFDQQDGIAWLTFNRPHVYNAMNQELRDQLWLLLDVVEQDPAIAVAVVRGAGAAFSSGADLTEFGTAPSYAASRQARKDRDLWGRLGEFEKPLIAAIHGYALGAGCELSLYCDFRIATEDARIGLPETTLGYLPSAGGTQMTPRLIGLGRALDLISTGVPVNARQALEWGLVHAIAAPGQLEAEAELLARRLMAMPKAAMRATREAIRRGLDGSLQQGLLLETTLRARLSTSTDAASSF